MRPSVGSAPALAATLLFVRDGLNAKQVQTWLGHHSPAFTLATYVHLLPDDLPEAAEPAFVSVLSGNETGTRAADTRRDDLPAEEAVSA